MSRPGIADLGRVVPVIADTGTDGQGEVLIDITGNICGKDAITVAAIGITILLVGKGLPACTDSLSIAVCLFVAVQNARLD